MDQKQYLYFNSRDELLRIDVSNIVYFEADGNYTTIMLRNKLRCTVGMNLGAMGKLLSEQLGDHARKFMRIGKRFIVCTDYILLVNTLKQRLILSDGASFNMQVEISKEALRKVKDIVLGAKI